MLKKAACFILCIILITSKGYSAGPVTHVFLANEWLDDISLTSHEKSVFILGTLFPDIRYLGEVSRDETHEEGLTLDDLLNSPSLFSEGMRLHAFIDEMREKLVVQWGIYDLVNEFARGHLSTILKLVEDEILYCRILPNEVLDALQITAEEEMQGKVSAGTIQNWHKFLSLYFSKRPSDVLKHLSKTNQGFLNVPPETVKLWAEVVPMLSKKKELTDYVDRLAKSFSEVFNSVSFSSVYVGIGKRDITPPIGTPSAGYVSRLGMGMLGVHDPLLASAMAIKSNGKMIILCSVDNLGFTYEIVQEIINKVRGLPDFSESEIYIGSSHTHSGGGAFLNIPTIGEKLAGRYDANITQLYIDRTTEAILEAGKNLIPAKIGIGYGKATEITSYRGLWPTNVHPLSDVAILKATKMDGSPLAVLFNFPIHPTVLDHHNRLFSADLIGFARDHLKSLIGNDIEPIYFNGAQGDIIPAFSEKKDPFISCFEIGESLAKSVKEIWDSTEVQNCIEISTNQKKYSFKPEATPFGLKLPLDIYNSEINLIIFNKKHAFITIPGELSCIYDKNFKVYGEQLGFSHVSVLGLVNDAHGYIILPESWSNKTYESNLSFGGEFYGQRIEEMVYELMRDCLN